MIKSLLKLSLALLAAAALFGCSPENSAEREKLAMENITMGRAFLAENSGKDGVVSLPSGLQYRILRAGNGKQPEPASKVTVHYRGTFINGEVFDSSYARGEPANFAANRVIPGWTEALQLMREGGKWQLFIPHQLAYGERGAGSAIGPNETLIFEVELIRVDG